MHNYPRDFLHTVLVQKMEQLVLESRKEAKTAKSLLFIFL